ncbi:MAG: VOC family protein [Nocardioidaceae bacterium]
MAVARFKDLCIDTDETDLLSRFWARALGLTHDSDVGGGAGSLTGSEPGRHVWMNTVPEPKTVKHRVHLDVHAASVDELVAWGATVLEPAEEYHRHWTVMADPQGGEFCAFVRSPEQLPDYRLYELVIDSSMPRDLAAWWGEVLGARLRGGENQDWWWLDDVPGLPFESWVFVPVPEAKTVKNRIHWDVLVDSVDELKRAGARLLRAKDDEIGWNVLADPEGNEFCAFER